jgi:hypothetical protein
MKLEDFHNMARTVVTGWIGKYPQKVPEVPYSIYAQNNAKFVQLILEFGRLVK